MEPACMATSWAPRSSRLARDWSPARSSGSSSSWRHGDGSLKGVEVPPQVLIAHWQDVARAANAMRRTVTQPEQLWLLDEYIRYLQEEMLSDPDALTTASALALMEYRAARAAAAGICEHADAVIQETWGDRYEHRKTSESTRLLHMAWSIGQPMTPTAKGRQRARLGGPAGSNGDCPTQGAWTG